MKPIKQGDLDGLCGVYSIINADRIINGTSFNKSQQLFNSIIDFIDQKQLFSSIFREGLPSKHIKSVFSEVVQDRIPYHKRHFAGKRTPDLDTFWNELSAFFATNPKSAVILCLSGFHNHWTVAESITNRQIQLVDSDYLSHLNKAHCATVDPENAMRHRLNPALAYFLSK